MNAINPIRCWTIPAVIVLALQICTESTAATLIQLKDSVQVQASVVRLGDVAVVSDINPETVKRLPVFSALKGNAVKDLSTIIIRD